MASSTVPPPDQAGTGALRAELLPRLHRRAERPGLARPWQGHAILERHRRMVSRLPLAELLQRRAEMLADASPAWAPIVYARPAVPLPARAAPGSGPARTAAGPTPASREGAPPRPVALAMATRTAPGPATATAGPAANRDGMATPPQRAPARPAPPHAPARAGPPAAWFVKERLAGVTAASSAAREARPPAARPAAPEQPLAATRIAPAGLASPGELTAPPGPRQPAAESALAARPRVRPAPAPGPMLVAAAPHSRPSSAQLSPQPPPQPWVTAGGMTSYLPVRTAADRPVPGAARPVPQAADPRAGRAGASALPVVHERVAPVPGPAGTARPVPAGGRASLPLARATSGREPAGVPAWPVTPGGGRSPRRPPLGRDTRAAAAVPAARGPGADRDRPRPGRSRAVLAPAEIDRIADKVQRKLTRRLAIEDERRGLAR